MTADEIKVKIDSGAYEPSVVRITPEKEDAEKHRKEWDEYRHEKTVKEYEFRTDLAEAYGVTGHPKELRLFQLAWEHGHSNGFLEVMHQYEDFLQLVK